MRQAPDRDLDEALIRDALTITSRLEEHLGGKYFDLAEVGSDLASDDRIMGPLATSHLVGHCLAASLDYLRTARTVLQDPERPGGLRLPMVGIYPLVRSSLESTSLAIWLVSPDSQKERLQRSLAARWDEISHDDALAIALTASRPANNRQDVSRQQAARRENTKRIRRQKAELREVAKRHAIDEITFNRGLRGYGPIVEDASAAINDRLAYSTWRLVSGLTHPSAARSMAASDVEVEFQSNETAAPALFRASPTILGTTLGLSVRFHVAALREVAKRGGNNRLSMSTS